MFDKIDWQGHVNYVRELAGDPSAGQMIQWALLVAGIVVAIRTVKVAAAWTWDAVKTPVVLPYQAVVGTYRTFADPKSWLRRTASVLACLFKRNPVEMSALARGILASLGSLRLKYELPNEKQKWERVFIEKKDGAPPGSKFPLVAYFKEDGKPDEMFIEGRRVCELLPAKEMKLIWQKARARANELKEVRYSIDRCALQATVVEAAFGPRDVSRKDQSADSPRRNLAGQPVTQLSAEKCIEESCASVYRGD